MSQSYSTHNKIFFYGLVLVLGGLTLWLMSSYLDIITFSLVMVIILKPVYDFFSFAAASAARHSFHLNDHHHAAGRADPVVADAAHRHGPPTGWNRPA